MEGIFGTATTIVLTSVHRNMFSKMICVLFSSKCEDYYLHIKQIYQLPAGSLLLVV